ncbi:MAG: riboflavin synthase [Desulfobacterales bacterium]|jgi:riboflavin synthase|nr:riboflavin synthase [Desulfobacterales bacterium]
MFTGIIEGLGVIAAVRAAGQGRRLSIQSDFDLSGSKIGDSLSVSGACLTAVRLTARSFEADVSPETLAKTTFGQARAGDRVNLERAMRLSDRIDGHLVSGHIDGTGVIESRQAVGNVIVVTLRVPEALARYLIVKGSVAVDGVSLTVNAIESTRFAVSIIPHTAALTTIGLKNTGAPVNIETDMIGRYVERFLTAGRDAAAPPSGVTMEMLAKAGYIR